MAVVLRAITDFEDQRVAKFHPQSGAWPPATGEVLIERAVDRMTPIRLGAALAIELPNGELHTLRIAGTTHDPGNAPAWQERMIYGYISVETLARLDADHQLDQLQVVIGEKTIASIESAMRSLSLWLRAGGEAVRFIRIPPPGAHPHQWQIDTVALFLLGFGLLAVVLEAALLAIVIGGLLAPQVRQIAVMKAIGARTSQIAGLYAALVLTLALAAVSAGLPLGALVGHWFAGFIADLLNFHIDNDSVPISVYGFLVALGLLVPLAAACLPILFAARKSVRDSIDCSGVRASGQHRRLQLLASKVRVGNVGVQLAIRNLTRRKSQALLAVSLLVLTGATFMVGGNLLRLWQTVTNESVADQRFDMQVQLRRAESEIATVKLIQSVAGVRVVEPARMQWASIDAGDQLSFSTRSVPLRTVIPGSDLQRQDIGSGRWLTTDDRDAVVLNTAARARVFPNVQLGQWIALLVNDRPVRLQVVGIAKGTFSSEEAYTTPSALAAVMESSSQVRSLRVGLQQGVDAEAVADAIETALESNAIATRNVYTKDTNSASITAHTYMLIAMLLLIVVSVAKIAVAGLASCMSTAVIERTREFGVMRTLGARAHDIQNSIVVEAILIGLGSWLVAVLVAVPLTVWIGALMSGVLNRAMPIVFSPLVAGLWLLGVALVAIIASVAPARRAARLTIRQTLDHT